MLQFITILVWLILMFCIATKKNVKQYEEVNNRVVRRYRIWFAMFAFAPIVFMVAFRSLSYGDTWMYCQKFQQIPMSFSGFLSYLVTSEKDKGFTILSACIKLIVRDNCEIYLLIIAIIQALCLIAVYRKYSVDYVLSIGLFIISTDYICWMYNGMRQFLAVTVIFGATTLMLKKKYGTLLIAILVASTFHQSALLMIPFVLIAQGKAWNKWTLFFILTAIIAVVFVGEFTDFLDMALADTQYKNVINDYKSLEDDGTNPIRVLIYSIPTILSFVGRDAIRQTDNRIIHFCVNMSIISTALYIVSMFTSGVYIGRLPIYASLYNYILLPWEINCLFTEQSRKIMYIGLFVGYLCYYFLQLFQWGII